MRTPRSAFLLFFIVAAVSTPQVQTRPPITRATSWADEYKRILKLFEDSLRLKRGV